ncbi:MAG: agglutinin biogenesis protein MshP [Burkholderiales bacterium]|jgi:MSHA biogenesis protein MshP|nr:agglutinin biogenesis protein MshP [Burkholderiales bacterium]
MKVMTNTRPGQLARMRGFSLVTGIFLLVVLSALGAFMVIFTGLQQNTVQNDVLGVRAYYAARAGINWAMYRALDPDNTIAPGAAAFAPCPAPVAPATVSLTGLGGSLAPFTVQLSCSLSSATEANREIRVYEITATACNQGSCVVSPAVPPTGYVERRVVVTVAKCKDPTAPAPRFACGP